MNCVDQQSIAETESHKSLWPCLREIHDQLLEMNKAARSFINSQHMAGEDDSAAPPFSQLPAGVTSDLRLFTVEVS